MDGSPSWVFPAADGPETKGQVSRGKWVEAVQPRGEGSRWGPRSHVREESGGEGSAEAEAGSATRDSSQGGHDHQGPRVLKGHER